MSWENVLISALTFNAVAGFAYRLFRFGKGGPVADVIGQAILGVLLVGAAFALGSGLHAVRWIALGYGLLFGVVVMPVWVLAVLIPLRPGSIDYAFTAAYWVTLIVIVVAAVAFDPLPEAIPVAAGALVSYAAGN